MSVKICNPVMRATQTLYGNGEEGLVKKVNRHEEYIQRQSGALGFIKWALGLLGVVGIANTVLLILKIYIPK